MRKRESPVGGDTSADRLVFPEVPERDAGEVDVGGAEGLSGERRSENDGPSAPDTPPDADLTGSDAADADLTGSDAADSDLTGSDAADSDVEVVDGFPVLAEVRTVERASPAPLATVQVAAVAATGFVAGAATVALVKRRAARKVARNGRAGTRRAADLLPIAASRSFLVDVHVLAKPE